MIPVAPARSRVALFQTIRWALTAVITVTAVFGGYYLYTNFLNRPTADVYVVQRGTAVSAVYGTVTVSSTLTLVLTAQNNGYLKMGPGFGTTVSSSGRLVKKGDLMATVIDEVGQHALDQARGDLDGARTRKKLGPPSAGPLKTAQDQLRADMNVSLNTVPQVQRVAAANEVERLEAVVQNETMDLDRQVSGAEAAVRTFEDEIKRSEVRAPMDGIVVVQNFNDNAFVGNGMPLFTLASRDLYVSGQVNEEDVGKLNPGMKAEMHLYAYGNTVFTATLLAVLPSPDPNNTRFTVTFNLDNPPPNLLIGLTGEMNVILGRKENALIVPARAVLVDQVLRVDGGLVQQRTVELGFKSLEFAEVTQGLRAGDQVIVTDQDAFHSGERVRPVPINDLTNLPGSGKKG